MASTVRAGRFGSVTSEKSGGVTYTPEILADFVADQIVRTAEDAGILGKGTLRLLDPAVGSGVLLVSLLKRLKRLGRYEVEVFGFEPNEGELALAEENIEAAMPGARTSLEVGDFLQFVLEQQWGGGQGDLFGPARHDKFDLVIANPPYVRTQIMGAEQAQNLAQCFGLSGRVDLYHAFILGMLKVLHEQGVAGIIVSNRFMTTKSGAEVRDAARREAHVRHVWDLGDTKLFDAAVLPAVLLFQGKRSSIKGESKFTSIYSTNLEGGSFREVDNPIEALDEEGVVALRRGPRFLVQHGRLEGLGASGGTWRIGTAEGDAWLDRIRANTWGTFRDIGKIRVGVKTCADKVFIRDDWDEMPHDKIPELLCPVTTHHMGRRFRALEPDSPRRILYPHETRDGKRQAADLSKFPRSAAYLMNHRSALETRTYVLEGGRKWYEIWVPQDPALWARPKLVFRDIAEEPVFWVDLDGSVVNGDCYWMIADRDNGTDLLWLAAAVANSKFAEAFYDRRFNNKLYAGRRRFITQYVEQFPLPDPASSVGQDMIKRAKRLYELVGTPPEKELAAELEQVVCRAFGLGVEEVSG